MNTGQHAGEILEAWKFKDCSTLGRALDSASASCLDMSPASASPYESERDEMLQSIVDHLRKLATSDALPEYSNGSGARKLLSHLSSGFQAEINPIRNTVHFSVKTVNIGGKRAKCFTEVDWRPQGSKRLKNQN